MGVSVKEVENLNKRIEVLNTERTKREARKGMLKEQLLKEISKYKDKYGVDLGSENLREMQEKIQKEANSIEAQVEAEYALKKKVVECLEDRDYDGAKRLLGIEDPVEDAEDTPEVVLDKDLEESEEDDDFGFDDETFDESVEDESDSGFDLTDNPDDFEFDLSDDSGEQDDAEDDMGEASAEDFMDAFNAKTKEEKSGNSNVSNGLNGLDFGDFEVEDPADESDDMADPFESSDDPFGFKDMLSGGVKF